MTTVTPKRANDAASKNTYTPADAKAHFFAITKEVVDDQKIVGIRNAQGKVAVVINFKNRSKSDSALKVTAQSFKENFSTYTRLASFGVVFKVTLKSRAKPAFIYHYKKRESHGREILEAWTDLIIKSAVDDAIKQFDSEYHQINGAKIEKLGRDLSVHREETDKIVKQCRLAMERIAIGHHPSRPNLLPLECDEGIASWQ